MLKRGIGKACILARELLGGNKNLPKVMDSLQTLQLINEDKVSISRYGDYEFNLVRGKSVAYQEADQSLVSALRRILECRNKQQSHVVGVPMTMVSLSGVTEDSAKFWKSYFAKNRFWINQYINFEEEYCDAQISRFFINRNSKEYSSKLLSEWKRIWDGRSVLVVEGEYSRFGVGNDLFDNAKIVRRIICPSENAFRNYGVIKNEVMKNAKEIDLALLVLGPTATVLAYDLAKEGIWAIDSGNLDMEYEWYLRGDKVKEKIPGKYSIEVAGGTSVSSIEDRSYEKQIISRLV